MFTFWIGDGRTACENITTLAKELGADCSNLAKRVMGTDGAAVCRVLEADAADLDGRHGEGMLYGKCIVWFDNSVLIVQNFESLAKKLGVDGANLVNHIISTNGLNVLSNG